MLERTPDRYGPLTHDTDLPFDPDDDDSRGRHRRTVGPRRNRRPRWVRTLGWVGAVLGILLVAAGGVGAYQYKKLSGNITRVDALAPGDKSIRNAAKQLDAENYLLIGSDTRAGANGEYGTVSGARSDTTILAHLSPNRDKAVLISFPRDSWVSLPACPKTGGGTAAAHDGQFNEAFTIGGPACTVLAVQKLTGIKINHYVQVDFTGFKTMVDALNGVSVCSTTPLRDDESGLRLPAGTSVLKGEQALAYVRARYGIGDGSDLGRIQRQQRFLGAMVRSATSTKLLVNPVALTKFLDRGDEVAHARPGHVVRRPEAARVPAARARPEAGQLPHRTDREPGVHAAGVPGAAAGSGRQPGAARRRRRAGAVRLDHQRQAAGAEGGEAVGFAEAERSDGGAAGGSGPGAQRGRGRAGSAARCRAICRASGSPPSSRRTRRRPRRRLFGTRRTIVMLRSRWRLRCPGPFFSLTRVRLSILSSGAITPA